MECGLGSSPKIKAYQWQEKEFHAGGTYLCFGDTEEIPTPAADIAAVLARMGIQTPPGQIILDGPVVQSWISFNDPKDRTMGPDPFVATEMDVKDFFNGVVLASDGFRITRFDVVEYECYRKGHTHTEGDRYLKRSRAKSNFLDQIEAAPRVFKRSNVDYILLSVVRDIAMSADAERFVTHIRSQGLM
jgi:hypothetical protein